MQEYLPLESLPPPPPPPPPPLTQNSEVVTLSVSSAHSALNPLKVSGPDGLPNWVLREYEDFLADPLCSILNSSFAEQKLPSKWKYADVTPLSKIKPTTVFSKHIGPILLTPFSVEGSGGLCCSCFRCTSHLRSCRSQPVWRYFQVFPVNTLLFPCYIRGHKLPMELALQYNTDCTIQYNTIQYRLFSWTIEKRFT